MSNSGPFTSEGNSQAFPEKSKDPTSEATSATESKGARGRYPDMQSATRFPIKLPIAVKSTAGQSYSETENISANGVLFQMESDMPLGSTVDFTISLPAAVLGSEMDVQLDCRGRVVRSADEGGRKGIGVVIDEYRFDRR